MLPDAIQAVAALDLSPDRDPHELAAEAAALYLAAKDRARQASEPYEQAAERAREVLTNALGRLGNPRRLQTDFCTVTYTPAKTKVVYDVSGLERLARERPDLRPLLARLRTERRYDGRFTVRIRTG